MDFDDSSNAKRYATDYAFLSDKGKREGRGVASDLRERLRDLHGVITSDSSQNTSGGVRSNSVPRKGTAAYSWLKHPDVQKVPEHLNPLFALKSPTGGNIRRLLDELADRGLPVPSESKVMEYLKRFGGLALVAYLQNQINKGEEDGRNTR
jgi:hypothetical protein